MTSFSVIITCYNCEKYIDEAVKSVKKQTLLPKELIFIDDYSIDGTREKIKRYKTDIKKIKVLEYFLEKNYGPSKARNCGWDIAKSEYICFLDPDDSWKEKRLEILSNFIEKMNYPIFISNKYFVNEKYSDVFKKSYSRINFWKMLIKNYVATPATAIKREISERYREDMRYNEDHELYLRLSEKYSVYLLNAKLTKLGRPLNTKGGLSGNLWAMRWGEIRTYFYAMSYKRIIIIFFPVFVIFSLIKHIKRFIQIKTKYNLKRNNKKKI